MLSKRLRRRIARIRNPLERKLYFCAVLTRSLRGTRPIIVGGTAVEFYTAGGYSTRDIDLVCSDREAVVGRLRDYGFEQFGRHFYDEELDLSIEIPGTELAGDESRVRKVIVEPKVGLAAYVIGVEDIIVDRLNAYVYWKSGDDGLWAREMMVLHRDEIDWEYLERRSREESTYHALRELRGR
jgi:hypothetical protein